MLNSFKDCKWVNSYIGRKDGILTDATPQGQSGPESNTNEGVILIPENFMIEKSLLDEVLCHIQNTRRREPLPANRESTYSTVPADMGKLSLSTCLYIHTYIYIYIYIYIYNKIKQSKNWRLRWACIDMSRYKLTWTSVLRNSVVSFYTV